MRNVAIPKVGHYLPAFVRIGWIRKGYSTLVTLNSQSAIRKTDELDLACIFLSGVEVAARQRMNHRRSDLNRHIGRHLPGSGALKQRDHAVGHELSILTPIIHRYDGSRRNRT